ncbi:hypothetical protein D3W54_15240 [Komagataeibacter medellinensis]|uniref:Twin-arginine translocation signal domain-containing protein n=1 Tax=Komagataeibacter medellinensis TaxID=1177712 RepID=A0ABQ6VT22_9PROT|nr:hypothetical protein [Komagataeibacter medellinensis]KAB8122530.1 hypothetical protein D3W54_15240 [Komagataeibacter medellinensis]
MHNPTRRAFLRGTSALAAASLAACTVTRNGTTITLALNVAKVVDYGSAILSFASTAIGISFVSAAMGTTNVTLADAVIAGLKSGLTAFQTAAGSSASVSYSTASVKAAFDSILSDVEKVNTLIIATITGTAANLSSIVVTQAKTAAGAAATLIDLLKAIMDMSGPRLGSVSPLNEKTAIGQIAVFAAQSA